MGNGMITIDIIVPSFRLQAKYLIPIVQMKVPKETTVNFIIIADDPSAKIPNELNRIVNTNNVKLFRNKKNSGASVSRNVGLANSRAEWILFLDDDIVPSTELLYSYVNAIQENPSSIGFFGETLFPEPRTIFTKGIIACDILTFFFLAGYYEKLKWAPTANVIIKSSVIGHTRFKEIFPKNGGGEDIDFFLEIHKKTNKELLCLPNAPVYHDWWYSQKRNYTRFTRWSFGDSLLHDIYPEYTYYNFPNIIESMVFGIPISVVISTYCQSLLPTLCLLVGIILGECLVEFIKLLIYKGIYQSLFTIEAVLIRASNDIGRLYMQLLRLKRVRGIGERFDHFCDGKHIGFQRMWAGIKFVSYFAIGILCFLLLG